MSVEQVARDFVAHMTDSKKSQSMLTPDAKVSGGILPAAVPAMDAYKMMEGFQAAFPDLKYDVKSVTVNGDKATVKAQISGTNTGSLSLPMPGAPGPIPATGKKMSVPDEYLITVRGDKVAEMRVQSPKDGGIPAALAQVGIKMPMM